MATQVEKIVMRTDSDEKSHKKIKKRLRALSKLDGRYRDKVKNCKAYFSEGALFKYRMKIEIAWLTYLVNLLGLVPERDLSVLHQIDIDSYLIRVCEIEKVTRHDVKAVEVALAEVCSQVGLNSIIPWIHWGLTSNDINSMAHSMMIWNFIDELFIPTMDRAMTDLEKKSTDWKNIAMLGTTHGQPATPVTLGLSFRVWWERLNKQKVSLLRIERSTKWSGATGGWNAGYFAYPEIEWSIKLTEFCAQMGFIRNKYTTQIDHYDNYAEVFDAVARICNIFVDMGWDMHSLIQKRYLKLAVVKGEVGSSTMPHKVNPIDWENMLGNFMATIRQLKDVGIKLPVSREQRDLTDSTTLRDLGEIFGKVMLGFNSLFVALSKISPNETKIAKDLNKRWEILAEAVQMVLRKNGDPHAYDKLKAMTREGQKFGQREYVNLIESLKIDPDDKNRLLTLTPASYVPIIDF